MLECFSKPPQAEFTSSSNRKKFTKRTVCVCDPVTCLVMEAGGAMERINKETGELSASEESTESTELKSDEPQVEPGDKENPYTGPDTVTALSDQLREVSKATAGQREEQLILLLPIFIQVTTQHYTKRWRS